MNSLTNIFIMLRNTPLFGFLILVIAALCFSCATTTLSGTWKDEGYGGQPQKIIVIMAAKTPEMRKLFEGRFVAELRARGNRAIQSSESISLEQLHDKELVKSRLKSSGADTVLISRLIDSKTTAAYVSGKVHIVPDSYYEWGTFYDAVFFEQGYTGNTQLSYVETNLYDIASEKLIWSAQSKTERTEGEQQLITAFIDVILRKLSSDRIIK